MLAVGVFNVVLCPGVSRGQARLGIDLAKVRQGAARAWKSEQDLRVCVTLYNMSRPL